MTPTEKLRTKAFLDFWQQRDKALVAQGLEALGFSAAWELYQSPTLRNFVITAGEYGVTYKAETAADALLAYVQDAGYRSVTDAADALNQTVTEFLKHCDVEEVR